MSIQKSPGGAYFPYYYKGGELFGLHLGSYFSDEAGVIAMMRAEELFFTQKNRKMGIWIDFYETQLTDAVVRAFVDMAVHLAERITKLGIVGCSFRDRWRINRLIRRTSDLFNLPVRYFDDPEDAKTWLVSELP